ncbi:type II toxin-antitoxin system VapC family toxin [Inquilinus sp. CA228]|uniref:type II toxin-antitoxin system VapC family toxin n=1 Tax=Inquilinus sp. CA228 TaxID=3455609 RepID=UPI003F8CFC63
MKITADTNVLIRSVVGDDVGQARAAAKILKEAELIAVALPSLCEFVWVLRKVYGFDRSNIATALRALIGSRTLVVNRPAAEAGLAALEAGGDFADGVIAYEGSWLGGETFMSFDRKAIAVLTKQGLSATLLS